MLYNISVKLFSLASLVAVFIFAGCTQPENKSSNSFENRKPSVYVTNYPLKYFAERIGGQHIEVAFPVPADIDPAFWNPTAKDIIAYQKSDLILANGATYEKWIEKATLPASKIINTSEEVKDRYITNKNTITHNHGPTGKHDHGEIAFTTWLDPTIAIEQAKAIEQAFSKLLPGKKKEFAANLSQLESELNAIDNKLKKLIGQKQKTLLFASHPVYQYLADRYKLELKSVHWEPSEVPNEAALKELDELMKKHPAKWMIWEDDPVAETKKLLTDRGIQSVVFNQCGNTPEEGDYMIAMKQNIKNLALIFKPSK